MSLKENDRQRKKENWLETEVIIAGFRVQGRKGAKQFGPIHDLALNLNYRLNG
jgi:hypothetical protein